MKSLTLEAGTRYSKYSVRGGGSTTYASQAPGAVINYISNTGQKQGGYVQLSKGIDFDDTKVDFRYGAPIGESTRFHVGGFFRTGHGPLNDFKTSESIQIKANITKEFDGGYIRFSAKYLDDTTPTILPQPVRVTGSNASPNYEAIPGFDPRTDALYSLNGEVDRTAFQLRRFATIAQNGGAFAFTDDPAVAGAPPAGHPAMMRVRVPLGPVAMFSASNFPFAFSVLGGDTASALAAGCSVVVKAHSGHLHTSARVYQLARQTIAALGLPEGLIQMVQGAGNQVGVALIQHPLIAAGAFTGSTRGGAALRDAARAFIIAAERDALE